jgi:hypothetical protein
MSTLGAGGGATSRERGHHLPLMRAYRAGVQKVQPT